MKNVVGEGFVTPPLGASPELSAYGRGFRDAIARAKDHFSGTITVMKASRSGGMQAAGAVLESDLYVFLETNRVVEDDPCRILVKRLASLPESWVSHPIREAAIAALNGTVNTKPAVDINVFRRVANAIEEAVHNRYEENGADVTGYLDNECRDRIIWSVVCPK